MAWKIIQSDSAEEIEFRNGQLDMLVPLPEQHLAMVNDQDLVKRTQHYIYEHVRTGYSYIGWNQVRKGQPTVFADKRVRQAMTMMIDRERIIEELFFGFASVASGPYSHLSEQADPNIKPWPYDVKRAVALLIEAGFKKGEDGRILKPDGAPFDIELTYGAGSEFVKKIALAIKDDLAKGGINLKLNPLEWSIMLERLNEKDFDAITLSWGAGGLESDIEQMFHTRNIKDADNRNAYSNPQLDALIEKAHVTLDDKERMKLWQQCHAILHEDQPYTFMVRPKIRLWLDKRIKNVQQIPIFGINHAATLSVPLEWYVPFESQKKR
jgi:peptide/nickel transport system substrate-binding protein